MRATRHLVALKILRADSTQGGSNQTKQADVLQHNAQAVPSHPGHQHVIKIPDCFIPTSPNGEHPCIIFEALGESIFNLQKYSESSRLSLELVRSILRQTLLGLNCLHPTCGFVHKH